MARRPLTTDRRALVLRVAARRVPWIAIGAAAAGSASFVWWRASLAESNIALIQHLRLAAVMLAASAATCLEDGCETLTVTTPYGRLRRRTVTLAITSGLVVAIWFAVAVVAALLATGPEPSRPTPVVGLLVELVALVACGWLAAAAMIARFGWRGSAMRAAVALLAAAVCTFAQPQLHEWLWAAPNLGPGWRAGRLRWTVIAFAAFLTAFVLSLDPSSRRVHCRVLTRSAKL